LRKVVIALGALLVLSTSVYAHADIAQIGDPGRSWAIPNDAALGEHIQQFIDSEPNEIPSVMLDSSKLSDKTQNPTCSGPHDSHCTTADVSYTADIPRCQSDSDVNCTSDFGTIDASGTKTSAVFTRYFPNHATNEFTGDPQLNVPSGVAGSIYSMPQSPHAGGQSYYLQVIMSGALNADGSSQTPSLDVQMSPVKIETSNYFTATNQPNAPDAGWIQYADPSSGVLKWGGQASGFSGDQFCVASSAKERLCAEKYAFPANTRYYVSLRLTQLPTGWMHGRIDNPDISVTTGRRFSTLQITGDPVAVPVVYKMYHYVDMPAALKDMYDVQKGGYKPVCGPEQTVCAGGRSGPSPDPLQRNVIISPSPSSADGMDQLKLWLPYVNNTATALPSFWSARTLSRGEMNGANNCFVDNSKISGIVTTNSTQYSSGPPTFDRGSGTLNYQVASPHYGTTGDVFKGSYDLVIRSDVARCIYGFSKAPISATVSVTSADGSPEVATTVVGEKDGWLYLQAKNFEFSAPTIQVKLSQAGTSASTQAKTSSKSKTITCVKGKVIKQVSAVTCPTGYKKR